MATIATISIDLNKLDKSKIIKGKNGAKYYNLNITLNDQTDQYGNNVQVSEPQTKEQRDAKEKKVFYGNGKVFWTDGKSTIAEKKVSTAPVESQNTNDDLPF